METNLEFVLPDARHRADVLGFYDEFRAQGETCIGYGGYEDFDAWLTGCATGAPEPIYRRAMCRRIFICAMRTGCWWGC